MTQAYLNTLTIKIDDTKLSYTSTLTGFKQIKSFFQNEYTFWENIKNKPNFVGRLQNIINDLDNFKSQIDTWENDKKISEWQAIQTSIDSLINNGERSVIYSKSLTGQWISKLFELDKNLGQGAYFYFYKTTMILTDLLNKSILNGYIKAATFDGGLSQLKPPIKKTIETLTNQWETNTITLQTKFDTLTKTFDKWQKNSEIQYETWQNTVKSQLEDELQARNQQLNELETTYKEKLKLEAPVAHWENRIKEYRIQGQRWLIALCTTSFILIIILIGILYNQPSSFAYNFFKLEPQAIKSFIILIALISFSAYLIRVFSRLTFSSYHLVRDAEERKQLTLVFLSLLKDGTVQENERAIILQSLFSRVETGLLGTDSAPEMPGFSSILNSSLKSMK